MSQMLFKEAGSRYAKQAWSPHQDNSYPLNPNQQYITTNIFKGYKSRKRKFIRFCGSPKGLKRFSTMESYREQAGNPGNISEFNPKEYNKVDLSFKGIW